MKKVFANRITEAGRQAITDLIGHVSQAQSRIIETYGAASIEADVQRLVLAYMYYLTQEYEKADPLIRSYVSASEERHGEYSDEVLCGLILLSNNCIGWGRLEDSCPVLERVKAVSERCSSSRDPLLEGLYDRAVKYQTANDPTDEQRGFILSLVALSWRVRYQSDDPVYTQQAPRAKSMFEAYRFVGDRWQWLISHCNHNLHDLAGLISVLLEKGIFPLVADPPFTAEMREESLSSLLEEFPLHTEGQLRDRILAAGGYPMGLEFMCPMCGSQDLRTKFLEPYYPISTLDRIKVDPGNVDLCDLQERNPSEYEGAGHTDGWEFWCDKCHLVPRLEPHDDEESAEESLARWLLDNCPQDQGPPVTETGQPKE